MSRLPNPSTAVEPVMKCNRKGCETQWVSTELDSEFFIVLNNLLQLESTMLNARLELIKCPPLKMCLHSLRSRVAKRLQK